MTGDRGANMDDSYFLHRTIFRPNWHVVMWFFYSPTSPPCWCAPKLIESWLNNWSSSRSISLTRFFALMLGMSLRRQTSRVKSLSSRDSFYRRHGKTSWASAALNHTLKWWKEAAAVLNKHDGWFDISIPSSLNPDAHLRSHLPLPSLNEKMKR